MEYNDDFSNETPAGTPNVTPNENGTGNYSQNQQQYQPQNQSYGSDFEKPMTVGEWVVTLIITGLPCVGFIMMLVWAFGSSGSTSRKNYCRALLIFALIGIVLYVILLLAGGAAILAGLSDITRYNY